MPLDPKQLPPYYTPGTSGPLANKFLRIHEDHAANQTSGTTETDIYTYTIPANTLTQTGDGLYIIYTALTTTNAVSHLTRFYCDNVLQYQYDLSDESELLWIVRITRISDTVARIISQAIQPASFAIPETQDETVNFAATIPIKFTGQCNGAGVIQAQLLTIDKQLK